MKKIFKSFVIALMAVSMVAMFSCKKDEDNAAENALVGTTWTASTTQDDITVLIEVAFPTATSANLTVEVPAAGFKNSQVAPYTFSGNSGTLTVEDDEGHPQSLAMTLKGDQLDIVFPASAIGGQSPQTITFHKK